MGTLILHPHWYPLRLTADQRYGVDGSLTLAGASQTKTPPRRRITNQDAATQALIGEWQSAYVETREEQIERLTTERDAAKKSDAETMEILTRAHATACKFAADVSAEKARADAAVKRLADLRAWAAGEVATWGVSCGCMGKVMLRIDRKDGEGQ